MPEINQRVSVVTGASGGLGKTIALGLANNGFDVVVHYNTDQKGAEAISASIRNAGRNAMTVRANLLDCSEINNFANKVLEHFGRVDVLVNNAGVFNVKPTVDLTEQEWDTTIGVNLRGLFFCCQKFGAAMIEQKRGSISNVSSVAGLSSFPMRAAYCASKAGVISLTKTLAIEWAKLAVRVNSVAPAFIVTEEVFENSAILTVNIPEVERRTPIGRFGSPSEVSEAVNFLASDKSSYVTGDVLLVDGGEFSYGYV
jgi:NAD(P)-dependent dehydrogenase (short-subunit alcohol dehydrogenase family)